MPYGIVLLPSAEFSARLVEYSNQLASLTPNPTMALDLVDRPPHVTLLHTQCEEHVARSWWNQVVGQLEPTLPITLRALAFAPVAEGDYYVPEGGLFFGVDVHPSPQLRAAHANVFALAKATNAEPLGAAGDQFSPHITLGMLRQFPTGSVSVPSDILTAQIAGHLALGRLGSYGTFPEILARATDAF